VPSGAIRYALRYDLFLAEALVLICSESQANNRLYAKRSLIGSRAVQLVEEFFKTDEFANDPTHIVWYAKWAVRKDGPAIFRVPTPEDCKVHPKSPQYIVRCNTASILILLFIICVQAPVDIFESTFVIQTFAPFVKGCRDSCEDYGYLVGALALSAAAVSGARSLDIKRLI
jgi:hypothetical protein